MNILFVFLISFLHCLLTYICLTILLISNNIKYLFVILCFTIAAKISYMIHGRCILTKYEENKYFYPLFSYTTEPLLYGLSYKKREEIIINLLSFLIMNKLFVLIILKYYNIVIK